MIVASDTIAVVLCPYPLLTRRAPSALENMRNDVTPRKEEPPHLKRQTRECCSRFKKELGSSTAEGVLATTALASIPDPRSLMVAGGVCDENETGGFLLPLRTRSR